MSICTADSQMDLYSKNDYLNEPMLKAVKAIRPGTTFTINLYHPLFQWVIKCCRICAANKISFRIIAPDARLQKK
jgi:hypothetical protein